LRAEWLSQFLVGDDLQGRIMTQAVSVVRIFIASHDLIDPLPQQRQRVVLHTLFTARVVEQGGPIASQVVALIEGPQRQQAGVASDLPTGKNRIPRTCGRRRSGTVLYDKLSLSGCSQMVFWVRRKPSVHAPFRASLLFSPVNSANYLG